MVNKAKLLQMLALGVVSAFLLLHFHDDIWTVSVDFAHHYALAVRIAEFGSLSHVVDPSLGGMINYPSLGHLAAAEIGKLFGSTLIGMRLIDLLSMIAAWAAIGWILWSLPRPVARSAVITMILLLLLNGLVIHAELINREVVRNYFYPQLIGQALGMLAISASLHLSRSGLPRSLNYIPLLIVALFIEGIHLLPALELVAFTGILIAIDSYPAIERKNFAEITASVGIFAAGSISALMHPAFMKMVAFSEHNAFLEQRYIPNLYALGALLTVVGILSAALIIRWIRFKNIDQQQQYAAWKYIGSFGLALTILCLLQMLALAFSKGSEYACRKYAYALFTILFVEISMIIAHFIANKGSHAHRGLTKFALSAFDICAIALLVLISFITSIPRHKAFSLAQLVLLESKLNHLNAAKELHESSKGNYAFKVYDSSPLIDYMFSMGILKSPRGANIMDDLQGKPLSEPGEIANIITRSGSKPYDIEMCRRARIGSFAVIDGACIAKMTPRHTVCAGTFYLTPSSWLDRSVLHGFSDFEMQGTWTDGNEASVVCKLPAAPKDQPHAVRIVAQAFVTPDHQQRAVIQINDGAPRQYEFNQAGELKYIVLTVPPSEKDIKIKFSLPDAASPASLGLSSDPRKLGLMVNQISFANDKTDFE